MSEFNDQLGEFFHLWLAGGPLMIGLVFVGFMTYGTALQLLIYFSQREYRRISEGIWREWVLDPQSGEGEVGEIIRYTQDQCASDDEVQDRFAEVLNAKMPEIDMRIRFLNIMVAIAPLVGLLGTVLGMLNTFKGIATGGDKTIDMISSGISEALITTEMGLLVALPGYMLAHMVRNHRNDYEAFLARLESFTLLQFRTGTEVIPASHYPRQEKVSA